MPYLMGLLVAFEGVALIVLARRVELVDVMVMDRTIVMVLGLALFILGMVLFVPLFPQLQRAGERLMWRLQVGAAVTIIAISLLFLAMAAPIIIEGVGSIGKRYAVLATAQLFFLGITALVFLFYEAAQDRRKAWLEWVGILASCLVMTEGVVIFGLRGDLNIHGQLEAGPAFMTVIGIALVALGVIEVVVFNRRREGTERAIELLDWSGVAVSVVIGALGLFALTLVTSMTLDGVIYDYYWLLAAGLVPGLLGPLLDYTQTMVSDREGPTMDVGLVTTIGLLIAIPIALLL
ncbi:MAG: hypothetical protein KBH31_03035 [Methanomassiliicoccales archaeon]|jgi:hypothetical protein|nr:hypothetical protein [Methanomassiliicoccales archaeon]HOO03376.1 hypothetical protein [Methanomassiliicoccales archaeon]HRR66347.1 hypothetical protein [Methanomassiliicoccales archaeon]